MIELRSVSKTYETRLGTVTALRDVSLEVAQGEFLAVVGPSGSGKSTLMNLIGCLERPTTGDVVIGGTATAGLTDRRLSRLRNDSVGVVFQMFNLIPELTVRENIELPLMYAGVGRGRRARALEALDEVGLSHLAEQAAGVLSGGEQQRAAVARALVNEPAVILADEPTGSLDYDNSCQVLTVLAVLHQQGHTVVIVTHSADVAHWAKRAVLLVDGRVTPFSVKPGALGPAADAHAPLPPPRAASKTE